MKFKTYFNKDVLYKATISCIGWSSNSEVYSCSDDYQILKWSTTTRDSVQVAKLPDFVPTDINWLIAKTGSGGKGNDSLLIASTDGRYIILNKSARVERNIAAHNGAISSCRWSADGSGLLTAGEDGIIKVFSRTGMLRSTVIQNEGLIVSARWAPNSLIIAYCQGSSIALKPLAANSKLIKWQAHDGLVMAIAWHPNSELIASCGEDTRYKIWDTQGTNLYVSAPDDYPITTLDFSPDGAMLAVGGFNMLKLCNSSGWSYHVTRFEDPPIGSLFSISWSPDATQIIAGSSTGKIIFGHVIEREVIYKNLKAVSIGRRVISLKDILNNSTDTLDFSDRIIKWELGYSHLVVATSSQIHIFNENYINTPVIVERNEVRIIILGKKNFLVVDNSSIWIYTYTGRLHLNPRYPGSQSQIFHLTRECISMGIDVLSVRDYADQSVVHIFDLFPGASRQEEPYQIKHKQLVAEVSVCRSGTAEDQFLVFIDINRDLYLTSIRTGPEYSIHKIGTQVTNVMWSSDSAILVGLHDSCYSIWYCPGEACSDPTLIALTTLSYDTSEFGKNISLVNFDGFTITFCASGTIFTICAKIYCILIHKLVADNQWEKALKICRMAQNTLLWACLAAMSTKRNQLEISEEAYSSALQIDKVDYMHYIKEMEESSPEQMAESALMNGARISEAETILLHNKKTTEAIQFCIRLHRWDRALEIAEKHSMDMDIVLRERKKYLRALGKEECDQKYLESMKQNE